MAFLLLVGCASIGVVNFDKAANTHIKTIALLRVDEPMEFWRHDPHSKSEKAAWMAGSCLGGCLFVLPAAAISARIVKTHGENFREAFNYHQIQFGPAMVESLRQELTNKGFDFIYLKDQSLVTGADERDRNLSHIKTDADAILFVSIGMVGYSALGNKKGEYKPTVSVHACLIDSRSKKIIYSRIFSVGELSGGVNAENMLPVEGYKYNSLDTLLKDINEAAQGIIDCQRKIAARIAEQLT